MSSVPQSPRGYSACRSRTAGTSRSPSPTASSISARNSPARRRQFPAPAALARAARGRSTTFPPTPTVSFRSANPVAITVIRTSSVMCGSMTAPKMILASSWAASWTMRAASSTSWIDRSAPPVKLIKIQRAPWMDVSSRSGLATAFWAASSARCSPRPVPVPIIAMPIPDMIVRTSAKSRFTSPGTRIRSEMPWTACWSTASATRKASISGVPRSTTDKSRWFGIVMSVSTTPRNASSPASACAVRRRPSNANGFVTTATVRIPRSLASDATTGAAPVPVPPPSPAVMKTMSAPCRSRVIWSGSSCAACRPMSGFEPAPRPCVSFAPSWSFTGAGEAWRACTSVLATMNSTPVNSAAIIRLTALLPPPPRPMTLIFAACGTSSSSKSGRRVRSLSITSSSECPAAASRRRRSERLTSEGNSGGCSPRHVLEDVIQQAGQASREPSEPGVIRRRGRLGLSPPADAVERQARRRRVDRALHDVGEATHAERHAASYRLIEDRLGELGHALHERGAAGDDDAGRRRVREPRAPELAGDERENLLDPRLDDLREDLARELAWLPAADGRHVHRLLRRHQRRQRAPVPLLHVLGGGRWRAEADRDVVRDVVAAERQDGRVPDRAVAEERDVSRSTADVHDDDAELFLVLVQDGVTGGQRLEDDVVHGETRTIHRADEVLDRGHRGGDDVHLDLEAHARHADGIADPLAVVHDEVLGQDVDDLAVLRQVDRARGVHGTLDVRRVHLAVLAGDGDDAAAVDATDVAAGDARVDACDLDACHLLGLADGGLDCLHRGVDVDDDSAPEAARGRGADADDVEAAVRGRLGDHRADLRRAHVEPDDRILSLRASHHERLRWRMTWSRNLRSTARTSWSATWPSTPSRRARRSSQSSAPSRTSTPSTV